MFTGDRSGDFLFRALYETGFASQPESDFSRMTACISPRGLRSALAVRCAPPDNKPNPDEFPAIAARIWNANSDLLKSDLRAVVVALGQIAFNTYLGILRDRGVIRSRAAFSFGHDREYPIPGGVPLITTYHPSQQNTSTGKLTAKMLREVFEHAVECA